MSNNTETMYRSKDRGVGKIVSIAVGLVSIAGAVGAWAVLPYRVERLEDDQKAIKLEYKDVSDEQRAQREILIRIEERIKRTDRLANGREN